MSIKLWFYNHFFYPLYKEYIQEECDDYLSEHAKEYVSENPAEYWSDMDQIDMVFKKSAVKRTKSTDILPANEYNRKRADVVEELTSKRINVLYKKGGKNYVSEDSYSHDTMNVVLASPSVKGNGASLP